MLAQAAQVAGNPGGSWYNAALIVPFVLFFVGVNLRAKLRERKGLSPLVDPEVQKKIDRAASKRSRKIQNPSPTLPAGTPIDPAAQLSDLERQFAAPAATGGGVPAIETNAQGVSGVWLRARRVLKPIEEDGEDGS